MPDLPIRKICLNNSGTVLSSPRKTEAASILNVSAYKKLCLVLVLIVSVQINFVINNCQARVQVPNPLSQQAPNPDPGVQTKSEKSENPMFWTGADTIITCATHHIADCSFPPPTFNHEGVLW